MNLVADRFGVLENDRSFDLASGSGVTLVTSAVGGVTEQARWVQRCDRFLRLRHRCIARLMDFGVYGEMRRFEAWRSDGAWCGALAESEGVRRAAAAFLAASGLSAGALAAGGVRACNGLAVVVPDADCGSVLVAQDFGPAVLRSAACGPPAPGLPIHQHGIAIINRRAVASAAELFAEPSGARPRALALWGPPGAGVRTAIQDLSRAARLQGFVPARMSVVDGRTVELLRGRSLCLIVDDSAVDGWRRLVEWSLHTPRPHVLLFAGRREVPHVDGLELGRVAAEALVRAVQPECVERDVKRRVERAAVQAKGNPGRFVQLLWEEPPEAREPRPTTTRNRAAEEPARYGEVPADRVALESTSHAGATTWPAAGELAALARRMEAATALVERGRHEPGCRALRQAIGGLARRHDWVRAAQGGLALVRALLRRGQPRDAASALAEARDHVARTDRSSSVWIEAAVLAGVASTDLARLDEAETILSGAVASARAVRDPAQTAAARIALGRCLFWRGRYDEANQTLAALEQLDDEPWPSVTVLRINILLSRIAVGRGDLAAAVSRAMGALAAAQRLEQPSATAHAAYAAAFAHLAVGDRVALERDVAACVQAARLARDPLRALRARLIGAEYSCHTGATRSATALLARIAKIPASAMPATLRARCAVLSELSSGSVPADILKRHIAATGLEALALFAPATTSITRNTEQAVVHDTMDILRCCQSAEDGRTVLNTVAARLRKQLHAAAISFVSREGAVLALDGTRAESPMVERVLAAGQVIAPHLCEGTIEGGAPVRYTGEPIAALVGRWALGTPNDSPRAAMALALAATATGPAVAEVIARGREAPSRALGEILGVSPSIAEVRRSVERAAAAPFAVLVEGESGSGKELVARALHRHGPRRDRPFCTINCAALPDDLVESELFGHARGAFTGAATERPGVFEEAHTGTLFLDEIGELSPRAQAKVLRAIQEGELRRLGENISRKIDVRIVAATNRDLRKESSTGRFRVDLMYRLDVVRITVPPLRERREDIALLAERFWQEAIARLGSRAMLASATVAALTRYDWPGNVRELQNVLASLAVRSPRRGVVPPTALPPPLSAAAAVESWRLDEARRSFEERFVRAALVRTAGHRLQAAEQLGVTRQGLTKLMTRLGISE